MIIVDTHAHIYSEDTERYPRIPNPYLPQSSHGTVEHLKREIENSKVHRVVIVQTFTAYGHDNRLALDVVRENQDWTTGVLNLDPYDEKSVGVMEQARSVGVGGNRVSAGWPADDSVLKEHRRLWEAARRLDVVICALLNPLNCRSLAKLLEEFPCRDMFDMVRQIINAYTPERCIWGSDFPTSLWIPKVTYQQHLEIFKEHLGFSDDEKAAILGETAMKLWF